MSRFAPCPRLQGLTVGPILGQHQPLPVLQHCWRHRPCLGPEFPQKQPKRIHLAHAQLPGLGTWQWADIHAACPWACLRGPAGPGVAPQGVSQDRRGEGGAGGCCLPPGWVSALQVLTGSCLCISVLEAVFGAASRNLHNPARLSARTAGMAEQAALLKQPAPSPRAGRGTQETQKNAPDKSHPLVPTGLCCSAAGPPLLLPDARAARVGAPLLPSPSLALPSQPYFPALQPCGFVFLAPKPRARTQVPEAFT